MLAWGPVTPAIGAQERLSRQEKFSGLSPAAREAYARLHGEMVFSLNERDRIQHIYGIGCYGIVKDLFLGPHRLAMQLFLARNGITAQIRETLDELRRTGRPQALSIQFPHSQTAQATLQLICIAAGPGKQDNVVAHVFLDMHPEHVAAALTPPMPDDSRLAVPLFRFKPNYQSENFSTNSFGFRSAEVETPKPPGLFRILCIGGSTTEEGADNASTYPALLEARLRQSFPQQSLEVINAGMPGMTSHGHLLRLPDYLRLEPNLVLIHIGVNDLIRCYDWKLVQLFPRISCFFRLFAPNPFMPTVSDFQQWHYGVMGFNLQLLETLFRRHGTPVAYISMAFPDHARVSLAERQYYEYQVFSTWDLPAFSLRTYNKHIRSSNQLLRDLSDDNDGGYIPVGERLTGGRSVFWDFCHMTQPAIQKKAAIIHECLLPLLTIHFEETNSPG